MDIAIVLDRLVPAADRGGSLTQNTREAFDALVWNDARAKPTWAEMEAENTANGDKVRLSFPSWPDLRAERNRLLSQSDWTQVSDAPLTAGQIASWSTYRQALRDLPETNATIALACSNWPVEPS